MSQIEVYRLVPDESSFKAQAFAEGIFSAFGHDPIVEIKDFSGEAKFVAPTFENASLLLTIKTNSLTVSSNIKEKDRNEVQRTMQQDVLEIGRYPEIEFTSNNVSLSRVAEGRYRARVIGDLTLHGVTQNNIWISGEVNLIDGALRARGEFSIRQTDYNIRLISVAGGTLRLKNEVKCSFDVVARKAA